MTVAGKTDDVADADFSRVRPSNSGSSANAPRHPGAGWFQPNRAALMRYKAVFFFRSRRPFSKRFQMMLSPAPLRGGGWGGDGKHLDSHELHICVINVRDVKTQTDLFPF